MQRQQQIKSISYHNEITRKDPEVLETEVGLELNEEELIATQETLRKSDAVHEIDQKIQEIQPYYNMTVMSTNSQNRPASRY